MNTSNDNNCDLNSNAKCTEMVIPNLEDGLVGSNTSGFYNLNMNNSELLIPVKEKRISEWGTMDNLHPKRYLKTYNGRQQIKSQCEYSGIPTQNKFEVLSTLPSTEFSVTNTTAVSNSNTNTNTSVKSTGAIPKMSTTVSQPKPKRPPPIILITKVNYFEFRKELKQILKEEITSQYCPQGLKILASNMDDYNKIVGLLQTKNYEFYTFPANTIKVHEGSSTGDKS